MAIGGLTLRDQRTRPEAPNAGHAERDLGIAVGTAACSAAAAEIRQVGGSVTKMSEEQASPASRLPRHLVATDLG